MSNTKYQAIESARYTLSLAGYNIYDAVYASLVRERAELERGILEAYEDEDEGMPYEEHE